MPLPEYDLEWIHEIFVDVGHPLISVWFQDRLRTYSTQILLRIFFYKETFHKFFLIKRESGIHYKNQIYVINLKKKKKIGDNMTK